MEIIYTYTVLETRFKVTTMIEVTKKVFDSNNQLLCDSTMYGISVVGHSGSFHQGHLADLYNAKQREIKDMTDKHLEDVDIDDINASAELCALASM